MQLSHFSSSSCQGVDVLFCSSWYLICNIVEYFVGSVINIVYCKILIDDI